MMPLHKSLGPALLLSIAWSCTAPSQDAPQPLLSGHQSWQNSAYLDAKTPTQLTSLLQEDLDAGDCAGTYQGLERLVNQGMTKGEATFTHMLFEKGNVTNLFLYSNAPGAKRYVNGVKELEKLLASTRNKELAAVYQSMADGDMAKVARALNDERGCLGSAVVEYADGLIAHSSFFEGVLALERLRVSPTTDTTEAQIALEHLGKAASIFASNHQAQEHFLCKYSIAQTLDYIGAPEEDTAEAWLATKATSYFRQAPGGVREDIEQHIEAYRSKLQHEVERAVATAHEAELRTQQQHYEDLLAEASAEQRRLEDQVLAQTERIQDLEQLGNIDWEQRPGLISGLAENMKVFFVDKVKAATEAQKS